MKEKSIQFKNINLSYTDEGKGSVLVFLHGFLGSKEIWSSYIFPFLKTNRVITIDLLGHGNSDCLSYIHSMEEMAEAVHYILHHLKLRRYYLIGHSMGGYVSLAMAENHPDNIKGLIMFHSSAKADSIVKQNERDRLIRILKKNTELFVRDAIPNLFNLKYKPNKRGLKKALSIGLKTSKQGVIAALEGMKTRLDREMILAFSPYPVLYIIGGEDAILDSDELIKESSISEKGTAFVLKDVGHMGFFEGKKETVAVLKKFIV